MQRAAVNDGLAGLSDRDILYKSRDVPTKLRAHLKQLCLRLDKQKVKLDDNGELDFSKCDDPDKVNAVYKKNPTIARIALMLKDLDFEYPMKLERLKIKADMLELIEEEEKKFLNKSVEEKVAEFKRKELIYEDQNKNGVEILSVDTKSTLLQNYDTSYLFDQDITNSFIETDKEREQRIRETWLTLRKKNVLRSSESQTTFD